MATYKNFVCEHCSKLFQRELRQCHKPTAHYFCSKICASAYNITKHEIDCSECGKSIVRVHAEFVKSVNHFCSRSCSATFHNRVRKETNFTTAGKTCMRACASCCVEITVSIHTPNSTRVVCEACHEEELSRAGAKPRTTKLRSDASKQAKRYPKSFKQYVCKTCGETFSSRSPKPTYCSGKCMSLCPEIRANLSQKATQRVIDGKTKPKGGIRCSFLFGGEEIRCDSILEKSCLTYFTEQYEVISMSRCEFSIPFEYKESTRQYIPDFLIQTKNQYFIVECKSWVGKQLNAKWRDYMEKSPLKEEALKSYAKQNKLEAVWFCPNIKEYRDYYKRVQKEDTTHRT